MTLNDLRADFAALKPEAREALSLLPLTAHAAVWADEEVPAGAIFCLRAETPKALAALPSNDPLRPHVVIHVGVDGEVLLTPSQAKRALDRTKYLADRGQTPDASAWDRLDALTKQGRAMKPWQDALAAAVAAVSGKAEERAIDSLFSAGDLADPAGFAGMDDWEVVGWFAVLERPGAA